LSCIVVDSAEATPTDQPGKSDTSEFGSKSAGSVK
jgi:hypothetical protein